EIEAPPPPGGWWREDPPTMTGRGRRSDLGLDAGPQVHRGRAIVQHPGAFHHRLELGERHRARRAVGDVALECFALVATHVAVEVLGEPIGPGIVGAGHEVHGQRSRCVRSSMRARCSWAFEVPTWMRSMRAISSCLYPSTSWRTKMRRAPPGSRPIAVSKSIRCS